MYKTVKDISDKWLCHGCGICEAVCPKDAIRMIYDKRHRNYVPTVDHMKCIECGLCVNVCPGKEINFAKISKRFLDGEKYNILSGHYINNYLAWATDKNIRWRAASGGIATALATFLLSSGRINKVVVVKSAGEHDCLNFQGTAVSEENDLYAAMGSKYCPVPLCSVLKEVKRNDRIAVFGLPCHIHGVRKAQLYSKYFGKVNILLIGIFCGGTSGKEATKWLIKMSGFDPDKLNSINYRGDGWPGQMAAKFSDKKELKIPYPNYTSIEFNGFKPWRCSLCSDGLAELADLSIGDAWLKEGTSTEDQGVSMVVTRSKKGEQVIQDAISARAIECENAGDNDAVRSQYDLLLRKKYQITGSMVLAKMVGRGIPQYDNIVKKISVNSILLQSKEEFLRFIGRQMARHLLFNKLFNMVKLLAGKLK